MTAPSDRCGFVYDGTATGGYCCAREPAPEADRCAWHASAVDLPSAPSCRPTTLAGADLAGCDFSERDLAGMDLADTVLTDASFDDADLQGVTLRGADLTETRFHDADLRDADLRGANLADAGFRDADLRRGLLANTDCRDVDFYETDLREASLRGASLIDADCQQAVFRDADLTECDLEGAFLYRADFSGADLRDARLYRARIATARIDHRTMLDDIVVYDPRHGETPSSPAKAESTYRELERVAEQNAHLERQRTYFVHRQDIHTHSHRTHGRYGRYLRARLSELVVRYGESPFRVLFTAALIVVLAGVVYPLGYLRETATGRTLMYPPLSRPVGFVETLLDGLYFSLLTFTTMTYGRFAPVGVGKTLSVVETVSGILLTALLVFSYGRRASR